MANYFYYQISYQAAHKFCLPMTSELILLVKEIVVLITFGKRDLAACSEIELEMTSIGHLETFFSGLSSLLICSFAKIELRVELMKVCVR